ncbi:MAG: hypothetical protein AAGI45_23465 [Cyanobacteria bacterium P01_H01_bin.26]
MTYTNTKAVNENFEAIKTEGGQRSRKIATIFKSAFAEAIAEVKDGSTTVRPLAKDLAGNAVQIAKEKGQEAYVNASKAAKETATEEQDVVAQLKLKLQAIIKAIKETLFAKDQEDEIETVTLLEQEAEADTVVTVDSNAV